MRVIRYYRRQIEPLRVSIVTAFGSRFRLVWTHIYGISIGAWFIGAIRGHNAGQGGSDLWG